MINICKDCGHRHRGEAQCKFCNCCWQILEVKKSWWKKFINWWAGI